MKQFQGLDVRSAHQLGSRWIILLDPHASDDLVFRNLLCIEAADTVVWRAELPSMPDVYERMAVADGIVEAATWSGYIMRLDQVSGSEVSRLFVK